MTEIAKRRRRWPWVVLAVLLLVVGGPIAWQFRPLNTAEKALVGRWTITGPQEAIEFRPDRRFLLRGIPAGSWSASETSLSVRHEVSFGDLAGHPWLERVGAYLACRLIPTSSDVTWFRPDQFHWNGYELVHSND